MSGNVRLRVYARMILLIVLRHWQRPLSAEGIALELAQLGFTGEALIPERIEVVLAELQRRIWELDLQAEDQEG